MQDPENRTTFDFVASTGAEDRTGDIIDQAGWQLDHYKANPVVLFAHRWQEPPVGKTEKLWLDQGRLMAKVQFAPTDLGTQLALLTAGGYIKALSVGLIPLRWDRRPNNAGLHIHQAELLEISVCPVPQNPDAVRKALYNLAPDDNPEPLIAAINALRHSLGG